MLQEYQRRWDWGKGVGSLSFDVQGRGSLAQFGPIRTEKMGVGRQGVQNLDIFHGCHKCMVSTINFPLRGH